MQMVASALGYCLLSFVVPVNVQSEQGELKSFAAHSEDRVKTISDHSRSEAKFPSQDEVLQWSSKSVHSQRQEDGASMQGGEASRHWLHSSIAVEDFMKLLCSVSDKRQMKEAKKYTWSVILVILACTFLGGMLGSPPGILLGGIIGSQLMKGRESVQTNFSDHNEATSWQVEEAL